jgi:nicotinate-nucleotide adenylyltransferase
VTRAIGVFGGTFDPIHFGHLRLAEELGDNLGLTEVRVIPARVPPHRATPRVTAQHRLEMVRLAIAANPRFVLDERECRREGPSYTVDTLRELRAESDGAAICCVLLGVDAFLGLTTWSRWRELFDLSHIVVAHRPGFELTESAMPAALACELAARLTTDVNAIRCAACGCVLAYKLAGLDISGTAIRAALRERRSVRYLLPDSVLDYIARNRLYQELDAG